MTKVQHTDRRNALKNAACGLSMTAEGYFQAAATSQDVRLTARRLWARGLPRREWHRTGERRAA